MEVSGFYHVALVLSVLAQGGDEAASRSAVGRVYYGLHHEISAWAEERGYARPRRGRHAALVRWLAGVDERAGEALNWLRRMREVADYDIDAPWGRAAHDEAWRFARRARTLLQLPSTSDLPPPLRENS